MRSEHRRLVVQKIYGGRRDVKNSGKRGEEDRQ